MDNNPDCQTCELMDNCSFYWNYHMHPDVERRNLIGRYCHSSEEPEACARIRYLRDNNESPPPFLSPEGDNINNRKNYEKMTGTFQISGVVLPV